MVNDRSKRGKVGGKNYNNAASLVAAGVGGLRSGGFWFGGVFGLLWLCRSFRLFRFFRFGAALAVVDNDRDDSGLEVAYRCSFVGVFVNEGGASGDGDGVAGGAEVGGDVDEFAASGEVVSDDGFGVSGGDGVEAEETDRRGGGGAIGGFDGGFEYARVDGESSVGNVSSGSGAVVVLNPDDAVGRGIVATVDGELGAVAHEEDGIRLGEGEVEVLEREVVGNIESAVDSGRSLSFGVDGAIVGGVKAVTVR